MKNWQVAILSVALAVFTWFLVTGREVVETWVDMPVVMTNPPEGLIIEDGLVSKIQVRLRGPKGLVGSLATESIPYQLDVRNLQPGERVVDIDASRIPLPSTYEIIEVKPNRLKLKVERRITKKIPVEPSWGGTLNNDYQLKEIVASPDVVELRGPETVLKKIDKTRVVLKADFPDDVPDSWAEKLPLDISPEVEAQPGQVRVEAFFGPKTSEIWVKVPLEVQPPAGYFVKVSQNYVRLLIEGPVFLFHDNSYRKSIHASLLYDGEVSPGTFNMEYDVILPEGCRLIKRNPDTLTTIIRKK